MARQWSATPSTAVRICSIPQKGLLEITGFFFYIFVPLKIIMKKIKIILISVGILFSLSSKAQCDYDSQFMNIKHVNCFGESTGAIDSVIIFNTDASFWWVGPNNFLSSSVNPSNLYSGEYTLMIMSNVVVGDTSSTQICVDSLNVTVEQTIKLSANFQLSSMCSPNDSVDVLTEIWGGTPPYTTLWSNGDTSRNTNNLPPTLLIPHVLTITDTNFCIRNIDLSINEVSKMNSFMSSVSVICKDDNSGEARVFVKQGTGTPPYQFDWDFELISDNHDSLSVLDGLFPGVYYVNITDAMGCVARDSVEVKSNPNICINPYKAFSPNDDDTHEFWEIENIGLYPEAIISIYDRNGSQIYRRRNYINAEGIAFGGKDVEGQPIPSGTYYYIINLENGNDVFKGTLTIVR